MRPGETIMFALITIISVIAGGECVYLALAGLATLSLYAGVFLVLGLTSGWLLWPKV